VGGNREAARLGGIRVDAVTISVYVVSAALATLAGAVLASQLLTGSGTAGTDSGLQSIAAVILGGASLAGGVGGVPGTLIGVLILGTLANGMAILSVPAFYQTITTGLVLLLAVGVSQVRRLRVGR
jgi:ribose/xylose/arabinose/galactoside ABC-type transport system permease subunit